MNPMGNTFLFEFSFGLESMECRAKRVKYDFDGVYVSCICPFCYENNIVFFNRSEECITTNGCPHLFEVKKISTYRAGGWR